jgi:hypothetical protein
VLGCEDGNITLVSGWNWFTGTSATAVGAGQYDFETIVMHELGHALGLGHSADSASVMFASLAAGTARRTLSVADLNVPDADAGPCGLHAAFAPVAGDPRLARAQTSPPIDPGSAGSVTVALGHNRLFVQPPAVLPEVARQQSQGAAGAVLVGGAGADLVIGAAGRDLLVGGFGANRQAGPTHEVVGASSTVGHDLAALDAVMSGTAAGMTGSAGRDWLWANLDHPVQDRITDLSASEFAADLDFILS